MDQQELTQRITGMGSTWKAELLGLLAVSRMMVLYQLYVSNSRENMLKMNVDFHAHPQKLSFLSGWSSI